MKIALTGATGFVGSHVLTELREHGHEVTAFVRDDAQADRVAARGATPAVVDLYDRPAVAGLLRDADGAIHTASPGDATSAGRGAKPHESTDTTPLRSTRYETAPDGETPGTDARRAAARTHTLTR
ncbi:MAG: NAD(P)H-binding protein [Trebonia sp.]